MTEELILLYPIDAVFFIFPRVNFSANEFDEFRNKVKENVAKVF